MYPSRCNIDDEEYVVANQPETVQYLHGEEVSSCNCSKMRLDEGVPTRVTPAFGCGFESVRKERVLDRVTRDIVTEIVQCSAEPRVAPGWVFGSDGTRWALRDAP